MIKALGKPGALFLLMLSEVNTKHNPYLWKDRVTLLLRYN